MALLFLTIYYIFTVIAIAEFVDPVSHGFTLPAGDNITLRSSVYNCDNLVLSQEFQMKVRHVYDVHLLLHPSDMFIIPRFFEEKKGGY